MRFQYYISKPFDGKGVGWYDYANSANQELCALLAAQKHAPGRQCISVRSGHFEYYLDIEKGIQQNVTTGTERPIRVLDYDEQERPPKRSKTSKEAPKLQAGNAGLELDDLFEGACGDSWQEQLSGVINKLPDASIFLGTKRDKSILPVRELTFQALKPNNPVDWRVVILGKHPYPRNESATGIALFDNQFQTWSSPKFGSTSSLRCLLKAALMAHHNISAESNVTTVRNLLQSNNVAAPPEWFASLLSQGVLLLNASLTIGGSSMTPARHQKFWLPVIRAILRTILQEKRALPAEDARKSVLFLWWGNDAARMRRSLADLLGNKSNDCVRHLEWCNPAAQGDAFCKDEPHLAKVNDTLADMGHDPINWLPDKEWVAESGDTTAVQFSKFMQDTQELHKMFLERLQGGLNDFEELDPIRGVGALQIKSLEVACEALIGRKTCLEILARAKRLAGFDELSIDEKGAIYLYTTGYVYYGLNKALRKTRDGVEKYLPYLSLLLRARRKLMKNHSKKAELYRGISIDISSKYSVGTEVTWWGVSSCSSCKSTARGFAGDGTLFIVRTTTAVPIYGLSAVKEQESILAPGTTLKVIKTEKSRNAGLVRVTLKELEKEPLVS